MAHHTATQASETHTEFTKLVKDIKMAMLTTVDSDGSLRSRPMATQELEFDGDLWFFTEASSPKVKDIGRNSHVSVSYANPDKQRYVVASGDAQLVRDKAKMQELWSPILKVWFPKGLEDPDLALIKVRVNDAEYWESSSNPVGRLIDFVKAVATGDERKMGDNRKLEL
jgi:general stress protein 26